jgi:hypothetical protein
MEANEERDKERGHKDERETKDRLGRGTRREELKWSRDREVKGQAGVSKDEAACEVPRDQAPTPQWLRGGHPQREREGGESYQEVRHPDGKDEVGRKLSIEILDDRSQRGDPDGVDPEQPGQRYPQDEGANC